MDSSKPFPIYQLLDAFEAFSHGEPDVKPQHRSLYYFLVGYARKRGNVVRYNMPYEVGMHGSGIGSWATYDAALKALTAWGFIEYTPGANRYKVPVIGLTFRNPSEDQLLTYWQSYCISTANPTDDVLPTQLVTLKEQLEVERKRVEELEKERVSKQTEIDAANAALASAQEKIEVLEIELIEAQQLSAGMAELVNQAKAELATQPKELPSKSPDASASHTRGAAHKTKTPKMVPITESEFADVNAMKAALKGTDYEHADIAFYHEEMLNWALSKGEKKIDWLATMRGWILRASKSGPIKTTSNTQHVNGHANAQRYAVSNHRAETFADVGRAVDSYVASKYNQ